MSIRINLLPPAERQAQWPLKKILTAVTVVVFGALIGLYLFGLYTTWTLERQLADTNNQNELLRPTREKMAAADAKQQQINSKNHQLIALTQERKSWYAVLTHLGAITPPQVWLTELAIAEKNVLRMKGMAAAYPDVAAFLDRLDKDDKLGEPLLLSAEQDGALSATRFEMIVKIKGL